LAKIAAELGKMLAKRDAHGAPAELKARVLAEGDGWIVEDVLCTAGPADVSYEERHARFRVAIVGAGVFQCRSTGGFEVLSPGSLLLGNAEESFECAHEHGCGDRCVAFGYSIDYFERLAVDVGMRGDRRFETVRVPPRKALAPLVARACTAVVAPSSAAPVDWEELGVELACQALLVPRGSARPARKLNAEARAMRAVRLIDRDPAADLKLHALAREADLSPYHFLRAFELVTGTTPHQYLLRARLRAAAMRLAAEDITVLDIALRCGFGDVSNFNRAFKAEFGSSPGAYRMRFKRTRRGHDTPPFR
jgi:AraC family transcriptional regulator